MNCDLGAEGKVNLSLADTDFGQRLLTAAEGKLG